MQRRLAKLRSENVRLHAVEITAKDLSPKDVSMTFGIHKSSLSGAKELFNETTSVDYALVGVRTRPVKVQASKDHVITYLEIYTSFDPPGKWTLKRGGLLEEFIAIELEAEIMRGFSWRVEVHETPKSFVYPPDTMIQDFLSYAAMALAPEDSE